MSIAKTAELTPNELNPRQISLERLERLKKSMEAYGDISGIVFNRRTRKSVGGHQRVKILGGNCTIECKYFDNPDKQGTVGIGYILTAEGAKYSYREVDWPAPLEYAAMIAANSHGGEWDEELLRQTLTLISEAEGEEFIDPETIGLNGDFTEKLFRGAEPKLNVQEMENKGLLAPLSQPEIQALPSHTSMVQLFFTVDTRPAFIQKCRELQIFWGKGNITDTVELAIAHVHAEMLAKGNKAVEGAIPS